jgi:hypothetical protein
VRGGSGFYRDAAGVSATATARDHGNIIGTDDPTTTNEFTVTTVEEGTWLSILMAFADAAVLAAVLANGMTHGIETSYARLQALLS